MPVAFAMMRGSVQVERCDGVAYKRRRLPAWADRILVHSPLPTPLRPACLRYSAVLDVATSDHKPVVAVYDVPSSPAPAPVVPDALARAPPFAGSVASASCAACVHPSCACQTKPESVSELAGGGYAALVFCEPHAAMPALPQLHPCGMQLQARAQ